MNDVTQNVGVAAGWDRVEEAASDELAAVADAGRVEKSYAVATRRAWAGELPLMPAVLTVATSGCAAR